MKIGIPKEIEIREHRIAISPQGVSLLCQNGHQVYIEKLAGNECGFSDEEYKQAGAFMINSAEEVYDSAEMIVKVHAPLPSEYKLLKKQQIVFAYQHLDIDRNLTEEYLKKNIVSLSYETIKTQDGRLPLLIPMSEIAGKMSIQIAANLLENRNKGVGILLGGIAGVPAAKVLIVGAGSVGTNATKIAVGMGADVSVLDTDVNKLRKIDNTFGSRIKTHISNEYILKQLIQKADVVICAILITETKAPKVITEEMVKSMKRGSVIVDVSIDQGGGVETVDRITTLDNPTFEKYGVIHYSVANMPAGVARTSTIALTNETIKYIVHIVNNGIVDAIKKDETLASGVTTFNGKITNKKVSKALGMEYTELPSIIGF